MLSNEQWPFTRTGSGIAKDKHFRRTHTHTRDRGQKTVVLGGVWLFGFFANGLLDLRPPPTALVMVRPFSFLHTNFGLQLEGHVRERTAHDCSLP